ncbi:MAG: hypothetical protein A3F70_01520 [Acidobacteria bacterium RIFCSPLOWO2_12_FULL_67_14]|nr:MAG: hypothetical protein A3H29_02180 [Acidobacteria bacterium RIFCSPLOWO2_02_FULL_67_21]OFW38469.1 MAG: hypothetical protein A3F70_01520 [Acidobacteria bacterium RIFCSPLOWO2_12_FULL_67_14]
MLSLAVPIPLASDTAPACRTARIGDAAALAAVRAQWNALLSASAADGPFLTWEWLHAWWTHLRGRAALHAVAVWDGPDLIAVAPLRRVPGALGLFPRLEFLGTGEAGSDYLDLIVRPGCEDVAVPAIADRVAALGVPLLLDHLPHGSLSSRLATELEGAGWSTSIVPGGLCPVIDLAGHTWDSYLATLGSAHRANVRRRLRGLEQQFHTRFERVTTEAQRREALAALYRFHEHRFETQGGSTAFHTRALRAFHDEATRLALERGTLRMYTLLLDDTTAAVMYGFAHNRQFYFYQHGFDDRYERHSIGLVLMARTIRAAIDERLHAFDLLWGTERYKQLWTRDVRTLHRVQLFPGSPAGRIRRHAADARRRLGPFARRLWNLGAPRGD